MLRVPPGSPHHLGAVNLVKILDTGSCLQVIALGTSSGAVMVLGQSGCWDTAS